MKYGFLFATIMASIISQGSAAQGILMTNIPAYQTTSNLAGLVYGFNVNTCRVMVCEYSAAALWWSKPLCNNLLTTIQTNGSWVTDITTAGTDTNATRIAAFVVSSNYSLPCVQGSNYLSTNIFNLAMATSIITRSNPTVSWLKFSGYDWWLKSNSTTVGPGPNIFSSSTNNAWVDAAGQLHLRITNRSNQWQCVELTSARTFGYGSYRFELNSSVNTLNQYIVLGMFTYSDDPTYNHREIDVECSRWNNPADVNNSQFVVQPGTNSNEKMRFLVAGNIANSTHVFGWQSNIINFQSQVGSYSPTPASSNIINSLASTQAIPLTGDETVHINFWLYQGHAPTDSNEAEVVIKSFQYVPLAQAPAIVSSNVFVHADKKFHFTYNTQPDRRYLVQATTNFLNWQNLDAILATNIVMDFFDTNTPSPNWQFYRAASLP